MRWIAMALQTVLGLLFLFSAATKLTGGAEEIRLHLGIEPWFWVVTAMVETVGAIGLLAGITRPRLAVLAGLWLAATMLGGALAHFLAGDPLIEALAALILMTLSATVAALRWRAARGDDLANAADREATRAQPAAR